MSSDTTIPIKEEEDVNIPENEAEHDNPADGESANLGNEGLLNFNS